MASWVRNPLVKALAIHTATAVASVAILAWVIQLWKADLTVPFCYEGDQFNNLMLVKGMIDNGWHLHNDHLGAPAFLDLHPYPYAGNLDLAFLKLISLAGGGWAVTINVYYLLTFPLTACAALLVFRRFAFSWGPAVVGSLLFAFAPYHLFRGEHHLFIGSYYTLPLVVMVLLWLFEDRPLFLHREDASPTPRLRWFGRRELASVASCLLVASAMPYYSFFTCYFLLVAGIACSLYRRRLAPLLTSWALIGVVVAGLLTNLAPTFLYRWRHDGHLGVERLASEAEWNGLKIAQLLLPISDHRLKPLARWKLHYNQTTPAIGENDTASLGTLGGIGFLILIAHLFRIRAAGAPLHTVEGLSFLNLFALLLGTMGGFGSLFNMLVSTWIRSYNRVSIFISFFSLFTIFSVLERLARRWTRSRVLGAGLPLVLLAFGIWDQTCKSNVFRYRTWRQECANDAEFIGRIESRVPAGARIWQLPWMAYPEHGPVRRMDNFDHFRAYLHARTLRWSFGAMRGGAGERWQMEVASLPAAAMLRRLSTAGFQGIYVDRYGFEDRAASLEAELTALLNFRAEESGDKRFSFFDMLEYNNCQERVE